MQINTNQYENSFQQNLKQLHLVHKMNMSSDIQRKKTGQQIFHLPISKQFPLSRTEHCQSVKQNFVSRFQMSSNFKNEISTFKFSVTLSMQCFLGLT